MNGTKLKILFISHEFSVGGSTMSLLSLVQGIKRCNEYNDIEVGILIPYKRHSGAKSLFCKNNINCRQMWYRRDCKKVAEKYSLKDCIFDILNIIAIFRIYFYIKREGYNIVCSNSTAVDVGARAAKLAGIRHVYYVREFMELDHAIEYRNKERMKKLLENSACVIFISKAIEQYYMAKYQLKCTAQFYNGFITQEYYAEHEILNRKKIFLIQVGTFQDGKGTINTIQLLHHLNESDFTDWEMEFVGEGRKDYLNEMQNLITKYHLEQKITVNGFCTNIKEKLLKKDILIMNSKAEGFGRVTVEGMLTGCLVLGKNSGGTKEIITDKVNGVLFESEKDFVDAIEKVNDDRDTYRRIAKSGQEYADKQFNYTNTAQNFMKVLHEQFI